MKGALALRNPVQTVTLDMSSTNITTSAWVQLVSSLTYACSAIEIFNPSAATMKFSTGAVADEDNNLVPYTILPGGSSIMLPLNIARLKRLSVKSLDQTASAGLFVVNLFG